MAHSAAGTGRRRWRRLLADLLLLAVVLLVGLWLFRQPLLGGLLTRSIEARLSEELGGSWRIARVGGDWLTGFDLHALEGQLGDAAQPAVELSLRRVRLGLRPWRLLGDEPLAALRSVEVLGLELHLNVLALEALFEADEAPPPVLPALLSDLGLRLSGRAQLQIGAQLLSLDGLHIDGRLGAFQVAATALRHDGRDLGLLSLRGGLALPEGLLELSGRVGPCRRVVLRQRLDGRGRIESELAEGRIRAEWGHRTWLARLDEVDGAALAELLVGLPGRAWWPQGGRWSAQVADRGEGLDMEVHGREGTWRGRALASLSARGRLRGELLEVDRLALRAEDADLRLAGLSFALDELLPQQLADLSLRLDLPAWLRALDLDPPDQLALPTEQELSLRMHMAPGATLSQELRAELELTEGHRGTISLRGEPRLLHGARDAVAALEAELMLASWRGTFAGRAVSLTEASLLLALSGTRTEPVGRMVLDASGLRVAADDAPVGQMMDLAGVASWDGQVLRLEDFALSGRQAIQGEEAGAERAAAASRRSSRPLAERAAGTVPEWLLQQRGEASLRREGEAWRLSDLDLRGPGAALSLAGVVDAVGLAEARVLLEGRPAPLVALLWPDWPSPRSLLRLELEAQREPEGLAVELDVAVTGLHLRGYQALPPLSGRIQARADQEGMHGQLALEGPFGLSADLHLNQILPAEAGRTAEVLRGLMSAPLQGSASLTMDLAQLAPVLTDLPYLAGTLAGELDVSGSLARPRWGGQLRLDDGQLALGAGLPPLLDLQGRLRLDQHQILVEELTAAMGSAPVRVTGAIDLDAGQLDLRLEGQNVLVLRDLDLRVRADAALSVTGPWRRPLLSGELGLTDLVYSRPVDWLSLGSGGGPVDPLRDLLAPELGALGAVTLDLRVSDGPLQGRRGRGALRIWTNAFAGSLEVDLRIGGNLALIEPVGTISTTGALLRLPFTTYRIEAVELRFEEGAPFDPTLVGTGGARMQGYELRVDIEGPLLQPRVEVVSDPVLPPEAALVLASTGLLPAEVTGEGGMINALGTLLPFLGRELWRAVVGPDDPDTGEGFFDRFSLRLDEDRSESGLATAVIEFRLLDWLWLYGERDRYDDLNVGVILRWLLGRRLETLPDLAPQPEPRLTLPDWQLRIEPAGTSLALTESLLLAEVRRHRREYAQRPGPAILADAAAAMQMALRRRGHMQARVQAPQNQAAPQVFTVHPGPLMLIRKVEIEGSPPELRRSLRRLGGELLPLRRADGPQQRSALVEGLRAQLILSGYARARVELVAVAMEPSDDDRAANKVGIELRVSIEAGPQHRVREVDIHWSDDPIDSALQARVESTLRALIGAIWVRREVGREGAALRGALRAEGHLLAQVDLEQQPGDDGAVVLRVDLRPGPLLHLAELRLRGYRRSNPEYLRRRMGLVAGEVLRGDQLDRALTRLRRLGIFRRVRANLEQQPAAEAPAGLAEDAVVYADLQIDLEEGPSRGLDISAGWGSYERLRGGLAWRDRNLFGLGRDWRLGLESSMKHYRLESRLIDRDLLGGDRELSLLAGYGWRERPAYDERSVGIEAVARLPLIGRLELRPGYLIEIQEDGDLSRAMTWPGDNGRRRAELGATLRYDARDDRFLPRYGWFAETRLAVAAPALGSQLDYRHYELGGGALLRVLGVRRERLTLALGARAAVRDPRPGSPPLTGPNRLYLGGAADVRSFEQDRLGPVDAQGRPAGGLSSVLASAELRLRLHDEWHGALFYDLGWLDPDPWRLADEPGQALGAGLRYYLPVGPLRLDAAYNPGEGFGARRNWAWHLAVGFTY